MGNFNSSQRSVDRQFQYAVQLYEQNRLNPAAELFQETLGSFKCLSDRPGEAKCLYRLGMIRYAQGDRRPREEFVKAVDEYEEAITFFEKAQGIYREIGDRPGEASSAFYLGIVYASRRKYPKATEYYQQALKIYQELGDKEAEATVQNRLNKASWYSKGRTSKAKQNPVGQSYYEPAKYQDLPPYPYTYSRSKSSASVNPYFPYSASTSQTSEEILRQADFFYRQSLYLIERGQFQAALKILTPVLQIYQTLQDRTGEASALVGLGLVFDGLGQTYQADQCYIKADAIFQELGISPRETDVSLKTKTFGFDYGQNTSANSSQRQAADQIFQQGLQLYNQGRFQEALDFFQQVLLTYHELGDRQQKANTRYNLGMCHENLKQYRDAIFHFQYALSLYQDLNDQEWTAKAAFRLGFVAQALKDYQ